MKKQGFLSLILSAVMTASCVPMTAAVSVSAEAVDTNANIIADAKVTGASPVKTKAADNASDVLSNDYLHVYNRRYNSNGDGLIVYFDLTAEDAAKNVYVEFDMRHSSVSSDGSKAVTRPNYNGKGNIDSDAHTPAADGTWSHVKLTAQYMTEGRNFIRFIKKTSTNQTHPFDVDNFVVYTEGGSYVLDTRNKGFESFVLDGTFVGFGDAKIAAETETAFYRAPADGDADAVVEYDLDSPLGVGYYTLTADMRIGEFTCIGNKVNGTYDGNYAAGVNDTVVTLTVGDTAVDTYELTPEWERIETVFYAANSIDVIKLSESSGEPIDIKNITLTYSGEKLDSEEKDSGLLAGAVYDPVPSDVAVVSAVKPADGASSYMSIEERGYGQFVIADITLDEKPVKDRTYYVSCYARNSVQSKNLDGTNGRNFVFRFAVNADIKEAVYGSDNFLMATAASEVCSNRNDTILCEATGTTHDGCQLGAQNDWTYTEAMFTPLESSSENLKLTIKRGPNSLYHHGFDMDSFKVWYVENGEAVVIYNNNFDDDGSASDFKTAAASFSAKTVIETDYKRIAADGENTDVTVTFAEPIEAGYYVLTGNLRLAEFVMGSGADNTASVTVTDKAGNVVGDFEIGSTWDKVTAALLVKEASESITLTSDCAKAIDVSDLFLALEQPLFTKVDEKNNLLSGAVKSASGIQTEGSPVGTDNNPAVANRYLTVGERAWGTSNFLTIQLDEKPVVGRTYYVGMKTRVSTDADSGMCLRLRTNVSNSESVYGRSNTNYLLATEKDEACSNLNDIIESEASATLHDGCQFTFRSDWKYIEAKFTPDEALNANISLTFTRGTNSKYIHPFDIDDFEVWYVENGEKITVFASDFELNVPVGVDENGKTAERFQSKSADLIAEADTAYTVVGSTTGVDTALNYSFENHEFEEGVYSVSADFKVEGFTASETAVNSRKLFVYFTYSDGTVEIVETAAVNSSWTTVSGIAKLTCGVVLTDVTFVLDGEGELCYRNSVLNFHTSLYDNGIPNIGIVMMLLAKKAGENRTFERTVEFIENGDLEKEPVIFNSAPAKVQTTESAGWYAKSNDKVGTTLTYVTEGSNRFIRVTDLDTSQRGIFWNSGVTLKPGTYTVKMDMRVSETEKAAAYGAKKWRDSDKSTMQVRANLGDPANNFSPNYAAFSPVDLDSPMNTQGQVYGNCQVVSREWTTYTDTIVIDKELLAVFKIGGGTGGEVDAHGFDIDNISIIGKVLVNSEGEIVEKEPEVNKNNLIKNGNFDEEPTVVTGDSYDTAKTDVWFQNDGMGYKKDNTGKDITTEPMISIDHRITWTDGYLTFSGRTNNLRQFWYNSGVTLKPGMYKFSVDLKTAKEGETSSIRIGIPGLFTPTADDAVKISDTWQTMTVGFEVKKDTVVRLNIWGGPGAGYTHDFCVDNVVLTKIS